jgi:hypothetical protein
MTTAATKATLRTVRIMAPAPMVGVSRHSFLAPLLTPTR